MTKPRINAQGMTEIRSLSDEIMEILRNRISGIAIDQCQFDVESDEEKALDEEIQLEGIILDMILQDVRREF